MAPGKKNLRDACLKETTLEFKTFLSPSLHFQNSFTDKQIWPKSHLHNQDDSLAPLIQTEFKIKKERKNMEKYFSGGTKAIIRMQSMYQLYSCSSQYKDTTKRI